MQHLQAWADLGPHAAWLQGFLILLGTFVLEDAATVLAAIDVQLGRVGISVALAALYAGIILGDWGLYGLGRLAARVPWFVRLLPPGRLATAVPMLRTHVVRVVFVSRFLPGARLPTYTACGYAGVGFPRFALATAGATMVWTSLLFGVSLRAGGLILEHLGRWRWAGLAGFLLTILLLGRLAARAQAAR